MASAVALKKLKSEAAIEVSGSSDALAILVETPPSRSCSTWHLHTSLLCIHIQCCWVEQHTEQTC